MSAAGLVLDMSREDFKLQRYLSYLNIFVQRESAVWLRIIYTENGIYAVDQ